MGNTWLPNDQLVINSGSTFIHVSIGTHKTFAERKQSTKPQSPLLYTKAAFSETTLDLGKKLEQITLFSYEK